MAIALLEALATDFLEYEYLVSLYIVSEDGSLDNCTLHVRITELNLPVGVNQQNLVELDGGILCGRKAVAENLVASLDFELLSCNINNCLHKKTKLY